jgi:hypothetical protein
MQKYVIERDLPGAGKLSATELKAISQKSRDVLRSMGTKIQWVQSYVTDDKIYCVYLRRTRLTSPLTPRRAGFRRTGYRASRISSTQSPRSEQAARPNPRQTGRQLDRASPHAKRGLGNDSFCPPPL